MSKKDEGRQRLNRGGAQTEAFGLSGIIRPLKLGLSDSKFVILQQAIFEPVRRWRGSTFIFHERTEKIHLLVTTYQMAPTTYHIEVDRPCWFLTG